MSHQTITIVAVVGGVMLLDLMIVPPLLKAGWDGIGDRFGPRPILADHIRRNFQSVAFGAVSFGACVHIAVDRDHLHLLPAALLRWAGCKTASIPWSDLLVTRRKGKWTITRLGTINLRAPSWCLEFAEPTAAA